MPAGPLSKPDSANRYARGSREPAAWPFENGGELAALYSFAFLLIATRGAGDLERRVNPRGLASREASRFLRRLARAVPTRLARACFAFPRARRPARSREIGDLGVEREGCRFDGVNEPFDRIRTDDGRKPLLGALPVGPGPQELRIAGAGDREHTAAPIRSLRLFDPPVFQQDAQRPGERRRIHAEAAGDVNLGDPRNVANRRQKRELACLHP